VKVLSTPMIMTTHAKEGNIIVGQEVPYAGSAQSTPLATGVTPGTVPTSNSSLLAQANFKKIAIDLKVTPLIGEDGSIQLKVDQVVDDLLGTTEIPGLGAVPLVGNRRATSYVNVQDGHLIVLGGLQRTRDSSGRTKLGFFWELPGISQLFGKRTKSQERTELLLFIRPTVVAPYNSTADTTRSIDQLSNKDQINGYLNAQQTPPPAAPSTPPPPPPSPSTKSGNARGAEMSRRK
jgi:general secretion pathway protein D